MQTLKEQKLERLKYTLLHPRSAWPAVRQMWRGVVEGPRRDAMVSDPGGYALTPARIFFVINSGCNLRCKMCDVGNLDDEGMYFRNTTRRRKDYLTLAEIAVLAESLRRTRPDIVINGTEPSIHPQLPEIVRAFTREGMRVEVLTNAMEIPRQADALADAGLDMLVVSVDGPDAATHDAIRGVPGGFDRTMKGIESMIAARERYGSPFPRVCMTCVIQPTNQHRLVDMAEFAAKLPLNSLTFPQFTFTTPEIMARHNAAHPEYPSSTFAAGQVDPLQVDPDLVFDQLQEVQRRFSAYPIYIRPRFTSREVLRTYYRRHEVPLSKLGYTHCAPVWHSPQIYPNGDLHVGGPCFAPIMGNLREASLEAIWNGERFRKFRRDMAAAGGLMPACDRCTYMTCTTRVEPDEVAVAENPSLANLGGGKR